MITRELQGIQIYIGFDPLTDTLKASYRIVDTDEGSQFYKDKEISVGAQVRDALAPLIAIVLEKLVTDTRVVTRPVRPA